jgi:RHS repeat-associated protein
MRIPAFLATVLTVLAVSGAVFADRPPAMSSRTITLPSGPAAMKGLGESFEPSLSTGAGNFSIPIDLPPALAKPTLAIRYTHGHGRSEVGAHFNLPILAIYRTKDKGSPAFQETDRFAVSGGDLNDELVPVGEGNGYYRLKNEGAFALFVRDRASDSWQVRFPNGDRANLGTDETGRQSSVRGVYKWFVESLVDIDGRRVEYDYTTDEGFVYLRGIRYQTHAPAYEHHVDLIYEGRSDPFTDYGYGSAITCRQRLARIEVSTGCGLGCRRAVRTYVLTYEVGSQSLLASVQLAGEGGTDVMPTLRFGYVTPSRALGHTVTMPQSLPLDLVASGRAQFDDVNGDGLPDLLVGEARNYTYYENRGGTSWSDAIAIQRSPDVSLDDADNGVVLADIDGDGFRDVLRASSAGYSYFRGGNVSSGRFVSYLPAATLATSSSLLWSQPSIKLTDLNFDGRTDALRTNGARAIRISNVREGGTERVFESEQGDLPGDVARLWSDPSLLMLDMNGDGAQDFVINEISWGESRLRVFYGLGEGKYAGGRAVAAPKGNPGDFLFGDINNDGAIDLLRYSGQQITYWLAAGDGRWLGPYSGTAWAAPSRSDARSVQLMDMDGNGTSDLVILAKTNRVVVVSLFTSSFIGLLTHVDNGMGIVTDIQYRSSSDYAADAKARGVPWRTTMPRSIPVVSEITVADSLEKIGLPGNRGRTTYEYADGYYDGRERELRGFGYVRATRDGDERQEATVTETWLHLGTNLDTGEDEETLKGKAYREVVGNDHGEIYKSTETKWEPRWLCAEDAAELAPYLPKCQPFPQKSDAKDNLVSLGLASAVLNGSWEKTNTPRYTLETRTHDLWGHVLERTEHGEVAFRSPRALGDPFRLELVDASAGDDERIESNEYAYALDSWIIGLTARTSVLDGRTRAPIAVTTTHYDGAAFEGLPVGQMTRGKVSRKDGWLREENRQVPLVRNRYNQAGQIEETLDPRGSRSLVTYDAETQAFAAREDVFVDKDDGGTRTLTFEAAYDVAFGVVTRARDADGNETRYAYDGLGRLRKTMVPGTTEARPSIAYEYAYGDPISTTTERRLVDATGAERVKIHYIDGAGRTRQTKTHAEAALGGYVASAWSDLNAQGRAARTFETFGTSSPDIELPAATLGFDDSTYDALGRMVLRSIVPREAGGARTTVLTRILPSETQVFDERDVAEGTWVYPAISRTDGLGRVRETVKYNDVAAVPGGAKTKTELRWTFRYDARDHLQGWTDPKGIARSYVYDSLGRMTELNDPNLGSIAYAYDDADNMIRRVDVEGQRREFTYGASNRILRLVYSDRAGKVQGEHRYHYDVPDPSGPAAAASHLGGKLAWVEWPTGKEYFGYDARGGVVTNAVSLWNPATSTYEAQSRDLSVKQTTFNEQGQPTREALPAGFAVQFGYDARGSLSSIARERGAALEPLVKSVERDANGRPTRTENGNGTASCAWFSVRGELVRAAAGRGIDCRSIPAAETPGVFQHLTYGRDVSGNVATITDLSTRSNGIGRLDASFVYDRLHQLLRVVTPEGEEELDYDTTQNVVRHRSTLPGIDAYLGDLRYGERGAGPNMVTGVGSTQFDYDRTGNLKSFNGYTLDFDALGNLVRAWRADGTTIRYFYDYAGERRISKIERPNQSPQINRYIFSDYQERSGEPTVFVSAGRTEIELSRGSGGAERARYYHRDHLNGTTHVSDAQGALVGYQAYGAYGAVRERTGAKPLYGFAGADQEGEESLGITRMGARYYAPSLGRWMSADRVIGESPKKLLERTLEANLFSYAINNPLNLVDTLGTDEDEPGFWDTVKSYAWKGAGFVYGGAQAIVPLATLVPVPEVNADFMEGAACGQYSVGAAETVVGGILVVGGDGAAAGGLILAPETGGSSLIVTGGGLVVSEVGVGMGAAGGLNMAMSSKTGDRAAEMRAEEERAKAAEAKKKADAVQQHPTKGMQGRKLSNVEKAEFDSFADRARSSGLTENTNRTGSWGKVDPGTGKFKEVTRIDVAEAGKPGWRGKTHMHVEGQDGHLPLDTKIPGEK